jgi:2-succinyl-5-enolpyruvyl-6-hydroxy-3-cyclohexene-1-carboxylate synthase
VAQSGLYGASVRLAIEPGVPRQAAAGAWRSLAARAVAAATAVPPGPVHLNLPFAEPLLGEPGPLPPARDGDEPWHQLVSGPVGEVVVEELAGRRGVVVAGRGAAAPEEVHALAAALGWPVLADALSGCRTVDPTTVAAFDLLVRAGRPTPEAVVRLGAPPASKPLAAWLAEALVQVVVDPTGRFADPDRVATHLVAGRLAPVAPAPEQWLTSWQEAEAAAQRALDDAVEPGTEPAIARAVVRDLGPEHTLVVASSMPVRDVEWFAGPTPARVLANRGANGIDGVLSTAVGVALAGGPTVALVGDLAFLHDVNALLGLAGREVDLTIVVVDNDGGGIFSFLPQADALPSDEFEQLLGTPHGLDLAALGRAYGVDIRVHRTDRAANVDAHRRLQEAVARRLRAG